VFSIIRDPLQREALLWHEVGHVHHPSNIVGWLLDVLFNIWGVQIKSILIDSLRVELAADMYAAKKMGNARPVLAMLQKLEKVGWGSKPDQKGSFWGDFIGLSKIMLGLEGFFYVHPNFEVRINEMKKLMH